MDVRLVRIDDRLIHGQVATVWAKETGIERIIVVSDTVAKDELQKFLLIQAAPPGVKANVVPVDKMFEVFYNVLFINTKVMLLFTCPQDIERLVQAGTHIQSVNIGGMRFSPGKRMLTNVISLDEDDVRSFQYLYGKGIELEVRQVPADRKINFMDLLYRFKDAK